MNRQGISHFHLQNRNSYIIRLSVSLDHWMAGKFMMYFRQARNYLVGCQPSGETSGKLPAEVLLKLMGKPPSGCHTFYWLPHAAGTRILKKLKAYHNQEEKPLPPAWPIQYLLLTKLFIVPAGKREMFTDSHSNITKQGKER